MSNGRKLDIGISVFGNPDKLETTVRSILRYSACDINLIAVVNPHPVPAVRDEVRIHVESIAKAGGFKRVAYMGANVGYAGAVNEFVSLSQSEYMIYCDSDIEVASPGWDETLCSYLDRFHELGMVFPNSGAYPINRGGYNEIMWQAGFCWCLSRAAAKSMCQHRFFIDPTLMDEKLGHQEEADLCMRMRMAGFKIAAAPEVRVAHDASSTNDPASLDRINAGVQKFVNKWNEYFNGKNFNYHSINVTRWEDWPPNALYLEDFWRAQNVPGFSGNMLNHHPEVVKLCGRDYDLIRVPRLSGFYRGRII